MAVKKAKGSTTRAKPRAPAKAARKPAKKQAKPAKKAVKRPPAKAKKPAKAARKPVAKKVPAKKAAPKPPKAPAKSATKAAPKTPAKSAAAPAQKALVTKPPAKTAPAKTAPAKTAPARSEPVAAAAPAGVAAPAKAAAPAKTGPRRPRPEGAPPSQAGAGPALAGEGSGPGGDPQRRRKRPRPEGSVRPGSPLQAGNGDTQIGGLPPIRPYRGTQSGTGKKMKPLRVKKSKPRDRFSKIFAEFETKPPVDKRKKRRPVDEEEEDTKYSVHRERPKLQIESPEQIRAHVLKKFLAGEQATCPVGCGGIAEIVRVGTLHDGSGEVWIECLSCAQRERFLIQKASTAERQAAQRGMEDSGEALCPRHGRPVQLRRRGRDLVCPDCGVLFRES